MDTSNLAYSIGGWANNLPAPVRKRIYDAVKVLASLGTLAAIVLPALPGLGIRWSGAEIAATVASGTLVFLGQLASRNTAVVGQVDMAPAPEVHPDDAPAASGGMQQDVPSDTAPPAPEPAPAPPAPPVG